MTPVRPAERTIFVLIAILALSGAIISGISLQRHYAKSTTAFCDLGEQFNCDIVNRSEYSTVQGIPVAAIGLAGYLGIFILSTFRRSRSETPNWLLVAASLGFAFSLYLTFVEAYRLMTWCILCLASQVLIFLVGIGALALKVKSTRA